MLFPARFSDHVAPGVLNFINPAPLSTSWYSFPLISDLACSLSFEKLNLPELILDASFSFPGIPVN